MPSAAYTANVTALAPENCCDRKIPSGTIGFSLRASTRRNAASDDHADDAERDREHRPVVPGALDERVHHAGEPDGEQGAAGDVEVRARVLVARLGHVADAIHDRGGGDRQVDDEHPAATTPSR